MFKRNRERITKDKDVRRQELAEAAETLFREKGFSGTSVDEIVATVGVAKGTFFYHFPSKEAVLVALGEMRLRSFREAMARKLEDPTLTPTEKVARFFGELATFRSIRRAVDWVGLGLIREDPVIHNSLVNLAMEPIVNDLTLLIDQGVESGDFRVESSRGTALCLILLCADLIHRTGSTEKILPWKQLRLTVWTIITRSLGLPDGVPNPTLTGIKAPGK